MSQHNTLTLEPCPFCGAQPEQCDVGDHVVTCPSCGVDGPYGAPSGVAGAIQGWNRRAALSATQPAQAAQGEPFGFVHHYVAHDSQGRIIDSTWEADGCEDEMPHPTHPIKWRWERSEPFYTKPAAAQGAPDHDKAAAMVSWVAHSLSYLRERLSSSHDVDSLNRSIGELYQAHALLKQPPAQPAVAQGAGEVVIELKRLASACPELNLNNYGPDDVDELNAWAVEVAQAIDQLSDTQPAAGADVPDMVEIMALADSYRNATCQEATATPPAPAQPVQGVPEGWEIREDDTWIYFKRPDGFCQAVTPNDPHTSHAQTLHMLMRAMLTASPTPQAQQPAGGSHEPRHAQRLVTPNPTAKRRPWASG